MITGLISLSATNAPQRVGSYGQVFNSIQFYGYSGFNAIGIPVSNTGSIYVGAISGLYPIEVSAGSSAGLSLPNHHRNGLVGYYALGSQNDGLYFIGW